MPVSILLQNFIVKKNQSFLCIPILKEIIIINLFGIFYQKFNLNVTGK